MPHSKLVLISGGREVGGVQAFASGLSQGFERLNIAARVVSNSGWWAQRKYWRDPTVLKILSTTSVFLAPFMCNTICVAHGFPRIDGQGLTKTLGVLASLKVAERWSKLVAVSHYVSTHLGAVFGIRCSGVVHNPLSDAFYLQSAESAERSLITYVGRLHSVKNIDRLLPAALELLDEDPSLTLMLVGDGPELPHLKHICGASARVKFTGSLTALEVQALLTRTRVFFSGCETEALGIAYLEALSQGCAVVMPLSGGGLELSPNEVGQSIFTFPLSFDKEQILRCFRLANKRTEYGAPNLDRFRAEQVARQYLELSQKSPRHP